MVVKFPKNFIIGANKDAGLKDRKNANKLKKAIELTVDNYIVGFQKGEEGDFIKVQLPIIDNDIVLVSKKAIES